LGELGEEESGRIFSIKRRMADFLRQSVANLDATSYNEILGIRGRMVHILPLFLT